MSTLCTELLQHNTTAPQYVLCTALQYDACFRCMVGVLIYRCLAASSRTEVKGSLASAGIVGVVIIGVFSTFTLLSHNAQDLSK